MRYLIAVFRDRIRAEEAYFKLESMNFAMGNVTILGKGYQSVDEYGLRDPQEEAWGRVKRMATWLVPFGFVAGVIFDTITGLQTFAWTGTLGNQILGGLGWDLSLSQLTRYTGLFSICFVISTNQTHFSRKPLNSTARFYGKRSKMITPVQEYCLNASKNIILAMMEFAFH